MKILLAVAAALATVVMNFSPAHADDVLLAPEPTPTATAEPTPEPEPAVEETPPPDLTPPTTLEEDCPLGGVKADDGEGGWYCDPGEECDPSETTVYDDNGVDFWCESGEDDPSKQDDAEDSSEDEPAEEVDPVPVEEPETEAPELDLSPLVDFFDAVL